MYKLGLRGHLLYLNGKERTLSKAQAHNTRAIPIELESFEHINPSKVSSNIELVGLNGETLEHKVLDHIGKAGINLNSKRYKRPNKGFAIEWLFSVTPGFECNYERLYSMSLQWLEDSFPECPIAHAIIHVDEADPHMHVVMVLIQGKRLPASKILGYKGINRSRLNDLYEKVAKEFGLSPPLKLTGATKKLAAEKTVQVCEKLHYRKVLGPAWQPLVMAIYARPEPFMEALNVSLNSEDLKPH
jgi:hypothetical protein